MSSTKQNIRVGAFVLFLLFAFMATLFLVSGSTKLLEEQYILNASWVDVAGLKEGSVVRLSGVDVGEVTSMKFADGAIQKINVTLSIEKRYKHRIRQCTLAQELPIEDGARAKHSSIARIDSIGILGDKYVAINIGDLECEELAADNWIKTSEALDIVGYTKKVTGILNNTDEISYKVNKIIGTKEEVSATSLSKSLQDLEEITKEIKEGNGLIHAIIYDDKLTNRIENVMENLEESSKELNLAITEIKEGDGLAHELIYGNDGEKLAKQLQQVSIAIGALINDIKNEESLVNSLIYDPTKKEILEDLSSTADALREASADLKEGDGTIALLMRDPALYEDLRSLVGGAQRNKLLRAYIRKTVEQNEQEDASEWTEK
jgi:phospholipid/cholesterol/gamma-HCH transport system substrate-binding protein